MRTKIGLAVLMLFVAGLTACQTKLEPTKTYFTQDIRSKEGKVESLIVPGTVVLDARPNFDYQLGHLPGSISLDPADFSKKKIPFEGELEEDLYGHARRLARFGIAPETPVLIVGKGGQGKAEEGRLAFILTYMGIHNVVFTSLENFSLPLVRDEAPARENVPSWKPVLKESMIANKKELREYAQKVTAFPSVIDVRSESEYLREKNHVFNAINIPWIEFLDKRGEPNFALRKKLEQLGLGESQRVIVIGNDGNTGALAAFVLMKMGFTKVGLYAGGYRAMVGSTSAK